MSYREVLHSGLDFHNAVLDFDNIGVGRHGIHLLHNILYTGFLTWLIFYADSILEGVIRCDLIIELGKNPILIRGVLIEVADLRLTFSQTCIVLSENHSLLKRTN